MFRPLGSPREARTRIARPQSPETPLGAFPFSLTPSLPLRRSVFDDKKVLLKKVLLIDPHQYTRDVRSSPAHQLF